MSKSQETNARLLLHKAGEPFELVHKPKPTPADHEVVIKVKVIALNPVDWKRKDTGFAVSTWPTVLGFEGSGVIDAVGKDVKDAWKVGEEVMGTLSSGYFAEYVAVPAMTIARKPVGLSFEDAASLPMGYFTASGAIHLGLGISLPFVPGTKPGDNKPTSVLVLGGSSAVGTAALQLLRVTLPSSATILTTCSAKHHSRAVNTLGATAAFDPKSANVLSEIRAATPGGEGVEAILDAVDGVTSQPELLGLLTGPKLFAAVPTGKDVNPEVVPGGVKFVAAGALMMAQAVGGKNGMGAFTRLLEDGKYKVPLKVEVLEGGLEAIEKGLDRLREGVSGTKLVIPL